MMPKPEFSRRSPLSNFDIRGKARRAQKKDLAWWVINLFILLAWFVAVAPFFQLQLGLGIAGRIASLGLVFYPIILVVAVYVYERAAPVSIPINRRYVYFYGALLLFLVFTGLAHGNAPRVVYFDLITFVTVGCAFILGRHDRLWFDIRPLVTGLTGISILLALRYTDSNVLLDRSILNDQTGSHFESVLTLVPLLAMVAVFDRARWRWYLILLIISAGCLLTYLYFGRRGVSVRAGLELVLAGIVMPFLLGRTTVVLKSLFFAAVFVAGLLAYFPFHVLSERYLGHYGLVTTVVYDNERWDEVGQMVGGFSPLEFAIGRGLGGTYLANTMTELSVDEIEGETFGRIYPHVGAAMPLLKGGFLLVFIYYLPFATLFRALPRWRELDWITSSAAFGGVVLVAFNAIDGTTTYSTPWIGFGIGLIASRTQVLPNRIYVGSRAKQTRR